MKLTYLADKYGITKSLRPATIRTYNAVVQTFINDTHIREVEDVTEDSVLRWKEQVALRSSETTYNNYHRHMKAVLNYAIKVGRIEKNPFCEIAPFRRGNNRRHPCETEDVLIALRYLKDLRTADSVFWSTLIQVIYYTGMRRAQVCGLQWRDIDFMEKTITLRKETSKNGKEWSVPLDPRLSQTLLAHKRLVFMQGQGTPPHAQVFKIQLFNRKYAGDRLTPGQISTKMIRLRKKSGANLCTHRIRHLFGTTLANRHTDSTGAPVMLRTLQEQMGHENISTTTGYIHVKLDSQFEMVKGLETL